MSCREKQAMLLEAGFFGPSQSFLVPRCGADCPPARYASMKSFRSRASVVSDRGPKVVWVSMRTGVSFLNDVQVWVWSRVLIHDGRWVIPCRGSSMLVMVRECWVVGRGRFRDVVETKCVVESHPGGLDH